MSNVDFFNDWKEDLDHVSHILHYLHTYPNTLKKLEIEDLLTANELQTSQNDWVRLCSQYDGMEAEFFKPYWVPLQRTSYTYFLDMSDKNYPVLEISFFFFKPYRWIKTILFNSIRDFMLVEDTGVNIEALKQKKLDDSFLQAKTLFKERDALVYAGKMEVEKPEMGDISIENTKIIVEVEDDFSGIICKNATSIIVGLLPFDYEIEVLDFELANYFPDDEPLDKSLVKTVRDLTHFIRANGFLRVAKYSIKVASINSTLEYCNGEFKFCAPTEILKEFIAEVKK